MKNNNKTEEFKERLKQALIKTGAFQRGDLVSCVDSTGKERARGLVNYASDEAAALIGKSSADIEGILGYRGEEEMIHRDNLVGG